MNPFDGVRIPDFPDLGEITDDAMLAAAVRGGSGLFRVKALLNYLNTGRLGIPLAGAKGDGTTDDTSAIQDAIDKAGALGADVLFDARRYRITRTLRIGDGSASAVSSYGGVRLRGMGQPKLPEQFLAGYPMGSDRATRLVWGGPDGGTMVSVRGPLQGWGLSNMLLDGAGGTGDWGGRARRGLEIISAMNGRSSDLTVIGCRGSAINSSAVASPPGVLNADALHNEFENIHIGMGWANGACGVVMTGTNPAGNNSDYAFFRNLAIAMPTDAAAAPNAYGIYLQACDSNVFHSVHFFNGHPACVAVQFDYTVNPDWPAGNAIYNADWGGLTAPVQWNGTPSANAKPNFVYAINECNGGVVPHGIPNTTMEARVVATRHLVGQSAAMPQTPFAEVYATGFYRLSYYLLVTGGSANGGNLAATLAWTDGIGNQSLTSPTVANGPGNHARGVLPVRVAQHGNVSCGVALSGIGGTVTTQYALMLALERLF